MKNKKILVLFGLLSLFMWTHSQNRVTFTENFDGNTHSFSMQPTTAWASEDVLSVDGKSCWGFIPDNKGDSAVLISPIYNLESYEYVYLRFTHICKILESDIATIEYKEDYVGGKWTKIPIASYRGSSILYRKKQVFNDNAYEIWQSNQIAAEPDNSWWKTESFDISQEVSFSKVQFRFKIVKGSRIGSQFAWGWLIDNFEVIASSHEINPPVVELVEPLIRGNIFGTGPFQIIAKAAPRTLVPLQTPILRMKYKAADGTETKDSTLMTLIEGDTIWMGVIPQQEIGTHVDYFVYATDTVGNNAMVNSSYFINRKWGFDSNAVAITKVDTPGVGSIAGVQTPVVVTIENRGLKTLVSATLHWTLNGVTQSTVNWIGTLTEGFATQVLLGTYLPQLEKYDTIVAWVSTPNGENNGTSDTIISHISYGCHDILSGTYTVGPTGQFASIDEVLKIMKTCGTAGNVTLQLESGVYTQPIKLLNLNHYTGPYDVLTITSQSGNPEDVVLKSNGSEAMIIEIARSHNVLISNVTIDVTGAYQGIAITDTVYNIEINGCHILLDTIGKTITYGILKNQNTNLFDRLRIVNNTINGGYYGIYLRGADNFTYNTNLYIDKNSITNSYYAAIYLYQTQFYSISENHIISRANYVGASFYGMFLYYCHGTYVLKNKIRSYRTINKVIAMETTFLNHLDTVNHALIANNEVIIHCNAVSGGLSFDRASGSGVLSFASASANIINNSILKTGVDDFAAINVSNPTYLNLRNNNIVTENGYPIKCANNTPFGTRIFMDYNNYFSMMGNYVGQNGTAVIPDITTWILSTGQDSNSANILPAYIDTAKHLRLTNYLNLECPVDVLVNDDIRDSLRIGITAMGCYTSPKLPFDIMLAGLHDWASSTTTNQPTDVIAKIINISSVDTLTSITINWSVNGTTQTPHSWTGTLYPYMSDTINIGSFLPQSENNTIKVWLSNPNGKNVDMDTENDTIIASVYGCMTPLSGTYTIGSPTADYTSINEAMQIAYFCGISDPVTFVLEPGLYPEMQLKGVVPGSDSVNTITFTSNNRDSVIFTGFSEIITLTSVAHLNFENLTIDGFGAKNAILFYGINTNISIRNCRILLDPTTKEQQFGIDLTNTTAINDNFRIVNNHIDGGYYGIRFTGGSSTTGNSMRFVVDSNTLTNQYMYSLYSTYTNYESVSNNVITARQTYVNTTWHGVNISNSAVNKISGNRIYSPSDRTSTVFGISLTTINSTVANPVLIANNEIILYATASTTNVRGINLSSNCKVNIYHNSVLIKGVGNAHAFYLTPSTYDCNIKNNNLMTLAGAKAAPILLTRMIGNTWVIDYNNYYTSGNVIGYTGSATGTPANIKSTLADWKAAVVTDTNSVSVAPDFVDGNLESLNIYRDTGMTCPILSEVNTDIKNVDRTSPTHIGAYEGASFGYNAKLLSFSQPNYQTVSPSTTVNVSVKLQNRSDSVLRDVTIYWEANGVAQTSKQWTGNLAPNDTVSVDLGSFTAIVNQNDLLAYTSLPNGYPDQSPIDDTIRYYLYGCATPLSGTFTVGGVTADFPTIPAAVASLYACGINGPVTLQIADGKYDEFDMQGGITGASATNTVTFVAASGNANDVIIGEDPLSGTALLLNNAAHLKFKHISFGTTTKDVAAGVNIKGTLTNVMFDSCKIMSTMDASGATYCAVYREATAVGDRVTDLTIDNCILQGGHTNLYLAYCGVNTTNYGKVTLSNSQLIDARTAGIRAINGYTILTIKDNYFANYKDATSYTAMHFGNTIAYVDIDSCVRNKIRLDASGTNQAFYVGSYVNHNSYGSLTDPAYIANNEFYVTTGTGNITFLSLQTSSKVNVLGNSIYVDVAANNVYGFSVMNTSAGYKNAFKYNSFYIKNSAGNIYNYYSANNISWTSTYFDIDYNNYDGTAPFAAVSSTAQNYKTLSEWQTANLQDIHSSTEKLSFTNLPSTLETDGKKAIFPVSTELAYDINHLPRISYTNAGCYHNFIAPSYDVRLAAIVAPSDGILTGDSATVGVKIENIGNALDSCEIHWKINGVTQQPYHWYAIPPLAFGATSDSIFIGSFIAHKGYNYIEVWTSQPNGQMDGNRFNDTLRTSITSCDSSLQGKYTVGTPNSDFASLEDAVSKITTCPIAGPVIFELAAGEYPAIEITNPIQGASDTNTVTFTSDKGRVYDVIVGGNAIAGVFLKNTGHLRFENITVGSVNPKTSYGVNFSGYCEDIIIRGCNIYADASSTSNTSAAIYYINTSSTINYLKDITIIKNNIQGGYYNIYLAYAAGASSNMLPSASKRSSITIDSNVLFGAYYYSIWTNNVCYSPSVSYNTITPRNTSNSFYGLYFSNSATIDKIIGNTVYMNSTGASYGLYATNLNRDATYGATNPSLIANNQFIATNGTNKYGIYRQNGKWNFINNSIYLAGTNYNYGLQMLAAVPANYFYGYNNIVIANGSNTQNNYPVYAASAANVSPTNSVYLDYNAYYSSTNTVGYASAAIATLADWQSLQKQDTHSVYMLPLFNDFTVDLSLADYDADLICNRQAEVTYDFNNNQRTILTIMGAYSTPLYEGYDLAIEKFVEPVSGAVECFADFTPIKISLYNQGTYTVDFSQDTVTLHFSCESDSVNVQSSIVLNTDSLLAMNKRTYEVYPLLNIAYPGMYKLKVWLECGVDEQDFNDTLLLNYYVEKSILPYDNNFSWTGAGLAISQTYGEIDWEISENVPAQPVFGDKSMVFSSSISKGSICQAVFPSVHLQGTYHPRLQFWYVHDNANPKLRDHMDVKISTDGGATFTLLQTLFRYDQTCTTPTWKPYKIDLANYTQGTCIIITFTGYSYGGGDQAIDRICIVAAQDMQLTMLPPDFSSFTACDLDDKAISVVMENMTNQPIPYNDGDSITIAISGANPRTIQFPLKGYLTGKLEGFAIDTIEVATDIDFSISGTYDIVAYVNAIDSIQSNDTDRVSFTFLSDVALSEILSIDGKETGDTVYPTVKIVNTGTLPVYTPFDVIFYVNGKDTVKETISDILEVGDTIEYTFTNYFLVPSVTSIQPYYILVVETTLDCDGKTNNDKNRYLGYVDFVDMSINSINYPTSSSYLEKGEEVFVEVDVYNKSSFDSDGVKIFVEVESEGTVIASFSETTAAVASGAIITHTFTTSYHVPTLSADSMPYYVKVFVEATDEDIDLNNDTMRVETYALNDVGIVNTNSDNWTLGQNTPNPAQTMTEIPYAIPADGTVNVKIVSISGQVLYQKEMQATAGNHNLVLDVDFLVNGIYYYSMEYAGKTIVKKMTIQK